jgi:hypothetical protein
VAGASRFRNKRGDRDTYALSVTHAYDWHHRCPCQSPRPAVWVQVRGRDDEGAWATAWLDWLIRTYLVPRGFVVVARPSARVIDVHLPGDDDAGPALVAAIQAGNLSEEAAPEPPSSMWDRRPAIG